MGSNSLSRQGLLYCPAVMPSYILIRLNRTDRELPSHHPPSALLDTLNLNPLPRLSRLDYPPPILPPHTTLTHPPPPTVSHTDRHGEEHPQHAAPLREAEGRRKPLCSGPGPRQRRRCSLLQDAQLPVPYPSGKHTQDRPGVQALCNCAQDRGEETEAGHEDEVASKNKKLQNKGLKKK